MLIPPRRLAIRRIRQHHRRILLSLLFIFFVDIFCLIFTRPRTRRVLSPPDPWAQRLVDTNPRGNTTVFIASVHRNTEEILKAAWNPAIVNLIDHLGAGNVYFSAVESGSQDRTKEALVELKRKLDARNVPNTVSLGMTVWEQLKELDAYPDPNGERVEGWIWDNDERHYALRRIPYLARVRNLAMEPLKALEEQGRRYDKVLWINDVVFNTEDFLTLLHTRNGSYAAACSMDFKVYPIYYDTFALRDDLGGKAVSLYWPWFLSPTARRSALDLEPIAVKSCWNGMVLFDSAPFYANPPLRFRGIDDSLADLHLEGSECCLIHADNFLSTRTDKGVWLNPNVRVGYDERAYRAVQGKEGRRFPGIVASVTGAWANRCLRWRSSVQQSLEQIAIASRLKQWTAATPEGEPPRAEAGEMCLINEMQIMWQNGWKHL
ncbi:Polysaccharide export protein [Pleurostoma richardsiae]|uniref:Polysaccharide export protein n=1 Tax=Pleurostoma richardsiae TaxID=41990 RepID=A0AA38RPP6_9PEZI|nr:Polysaccharide export protein [Pleurostoma richardsiae]